MTRLISKSACSRRSFASAGVITASCGWSVTGKLPSPECADSRISMWRLRAPGGTPPRASEQAKPVMTRAAPATGSHAVPEKRIRKSGLAARRAREVAAAGADGDGAAGDEVADGDGAAGDADHIG